MQQFVLEERLEIMCSESGEEMEKIMALAQEFNLSLLCCVCMQKILAENGDY